MIDVNQRVAGLIRAGDTDAFPGGIDRPVEQAQSLRSRILVRHVAKNQHHALRLPGRVPDRRGTIGDLAFGPIPGNEGRVVGQTDDVPGFQHFGDRIHHRLPRLGIDDPKDLGQRPAGGLRQGPAGQRFGDRIHPADLPSRVGGNDRIADGFQRDVQVLVDFPQCLCGFRSLPVEASDYGPCQTRPTPAAAPNSKTPTKRTVSHNRSRIGAYTSAASMRATRNHGESGTARTAASTGTPR